MSGGTARDILKNWGESETGPMNGAVGQGLAEVLVRVIGASVGVKTICDLGCGTGYLASRLGALGYQVTGVDASERLLAVAREHYASDRVTFVHGLIGEEQAGPLAAPAQFDLVVSSDVIEHLYHPRGLVEAAHHVLKPGGVLILGTPYHGYAKNVAISLLDRWDAHHGVQWEGGHIKFFSVGSLSAVVAGPGFRIERFDYYGRFPFFWKNMICTARKP